LPALIEDLVAIMVTSGLLGQTLLPKSEINLSCQSKELHLGSSAADLLRLVKKLVFVLLEEFGIGKSRYIYIARGHTSSQACWHHRYPDRQTQTHIHRG